MTFLQAAPARPRNQHLGLRSTQRGGRAWWHSDGPWVLLVVTVGAALRALTWSDRLGLGDAPETALGVSGWSVLHAPGYPLYVAAAGLFTRAIPLMSDDWALNLFSAVVTVAAALLLFATARRLEASRPAAAVASLGWLTAASVWFYAGFAKHDPLSTFWWAALLAMTVMTDDAGPSTRRCAVLGVLVGLSLGLGWAPIASGGLAVLWWARPRNRKPGSLLAVVVGAVVGAAIVGALVLFMSAQSPDTSWGGVDNPAALLRLWAMDDFGFTDRLTGDPGAAPTQTRTDNNLAVDLANYVAIIGRDLGPGLAIAGVAGLVVWWRHRRETAQILALSIGGNLIVVAVGLGATVWGFRSGIVQGGFLAPTLLGLALASSAALDALADWCARWWPHWVSWTAVAVLVVGTSIVAHRPAATALDAPVTRTYAAQVLDPLPEGAVVLAGSASSSFPLRAAQSAGARPDVTVIAVDGLTAGWYREQLDDRNSTLPDVAKLDANEAIKAILDGPSPVVLDHYAQLALAERAAYQPSGLTAAVLPDRPPGYVPPEDPAKVVAEVEAEAEESGIITDPARRRWPNDEITRAYSGPLLLIAQQALNDSDWELARQALGVAARLEPDRAVIADTLEQLPP